MAGERRGRDEIWRSEAAYFDRAAEERATRAVEPAVLERYRHPARPWFQKEFRFGLLGDVRGKRVLDLGCGIGDNAILLASGGAHVTGVDISPRSIEVARRRAESARLPCLPEFVCAPLEKAQLAPRSYDVVWGDGILHHVLHDLEGVLREALSAARDGARIVFAEPVDRVPGLRRVRLLLPIAPDGTADERPLVEDELDVVRRYVPDLEIRAFAFASRLNRVVLAGRTYEGAGRARRAVADGLALVDWAVLGLPLVARLGAIAVLSGHAPPCPPTRIDAPARTRA